MSSTEALNEIRTRAGMPLVAGLSQDDFRTAVRRERRVELAFEGQRFWDIRRWKIGSQTQTDINGVSITKDTQGNRTFTLKDVETRVWDDKMNLYPIPQQELYNNSNLSQNTGWGI